MRMTPLSESMSTRLQLGGIVIFRGRLPYRCLSKRECTARLDPGVLGDAGFPQESPTAPS